MLAGVGALLSRRRRRTRSGRILLGLALAVTAVASSVTASPRGTTTIPTPGLGVRLIVWIDEAIIFVWFGLVGLLLPLLFPDGRLPSRRWRLLLWAGLALVAVAVLGTLFGARARLTGTARRRSGTRWPSAAPVGDALEAGAAAGAPLFGVLVLLALASVVGALPPRARRRAPAAQVVRVRDRAAVCGLAAAAVSEATGWQLIGDVGWTVFLGSLIFGMPLAIGVAILRYRLYDIDLVIRRTLVYGALTLTLGAAYLGSVLLVGLAVGQSGFATAASTLAVAALFRPARARIQAVVDRRFYRRRYDAAQTLEAFGGRLRDELDLEALAADVRGVVATRCSPRTSRCG